MNYPLQSLVIIAPIIFLVLMIVTPVIGVFAGWKRAAYWGGGTFFFFLVGMIIWKAAGQSIAAPLVSLISGLFPSDAKITVTPKMVASLGAPIFFLGVMIIAELILLINYYAWFKRVAKIKQDIKLKKEIKAAKKAGKKMPKITGSKWTQMQFTTKGKAINMACGGAGLALLLAPSTVTFTQAVMYATTSATTRANNAFAAGLYNSLEKTAGAFSWMSYYGNADTGKDFTSIFATLQMMNEKTSYTYIDDKGVEQTVSGTVSEVVVEIMKDGFYDLIAQTTDGSSTTETIESTAYNFAAAWNGLLDNNSTTVTAFFQSSNVTEMLSGIIADQIGSQKTINGDDIDNYLADGKIFDQVVEAYKQWPEENQMKQIPVDQSSFNNLVASVKGVIQLGKLTSDQTDTLNKKINQLVGMMFVVA